MESSSSLNRPSRPNRRPEDVLLATDFSVADYYCAIAGKDRLTLSNFLEQRFRERYLKAVYPKEGRNGFAIMAICCLMIESLEGFRNGPNHMRRLKDYEAFEGFFKENPAFNTLMPYARAFYGHVRCGILHVAQTTGGWRIRRDGSPMFDLQTLTIEAEKFHAALSDALKTYCDALRAASWEERLWTNFLANMKLMCRNAGVESDT
jgi:hypothetical protein